MCVCVGVGWGRVRRAELVAVAASRWVDRAGRCCSKAKLLLLLLLLLLLAACGACCIGCVTRGDSSVANQPLPPVSWVCTPYWQDRRGMRRAGAGAVLRGRGGGICCCAADSEVDFQAACCGLSGAFFVFLLLPARLRGRERILRRHEALQRRHTGARCRAKCVCCCCRRCCCYCCYYCCCCCVCVRAP